MQAARPVRAVVAVQVCVPSVNVIVAPGTGVAGVVAGSVRTADRTAGSWKSALVSPVYVSVVGLGVKSSFQRPLP
jgi:hypothetical protein